MTPQPAGPVPRQLPPSPSGFVGRTVQLAELDRQVAASRAAVVLHGAGGMGKTALALHWAHGHAGDFPAGQLFLDLRGYGPEAPLSAVDALGVLLRSLGVDAGAIPADESGRAGLWRTVTVGRRLLVLLDDVRDPAQVRPLLPAAGSLVLVTSRGQLRGLSAREGAVPVPLDDLSDADARRILAGAVGTERIAAEPGIVGELIGLCGGMPLALRLVAELVARRSESTLPALVEELREGRLDSMADPSDPQADLRAVFSWS
ncbi:MAG: NB-ARC domain-containing protein [Micromonosporaceae bacterium]